MIDVLHKAQSAAHGGSLGARVGARAARLGPGARWPGPREIAQILLALVCLGAAAALFFGWLIVSDSPRSALWGVPPGSHCTSLGRAGERCDAPGAPASPGDCPSLGKGGRVCGGVPE